MDTINCPQCKYSFQISDAFKNQLKDGLLADLHRDHQKELENVKNQAKNEAFKKSQDEFSLKFKRIEEENNVKDERIKDLIEQITQMTKELRETKKEKDEAKLEMQKQLSIEEGKIRIDEQKKAEEGQRLKLLEKDKQLQDTLKELEDARRKLQQGSQQNQGEVFELEFENLLRREFPNDKISAVGKGIRGGDIIHEVWDKHGNLCGKILWELKNTKTWSEHWVEKLKADQRETVCEFAVLISDTIPEEINYAKYYKGVWVTKREFSIGLAWSLRFSLREIMIAKRSNEGKKEKADVLYEYLTGTEFKHRLEAIVEAFTNMQIEIEKEKRYFSNKWARDEKNIRLVIDNTFGMHGDLKGIIGGVLPQIQGIEMIELNGIKEETS